MQKLKNKKTGDTSPVWFEQPSIASGLSKKEVRDSAVD
jgi:hypothetical protein